MTRPMTRLGWRGAWVFARRDLNASFRGLRLLFVCLFLGVATLAAIGSLTAAITEELSSRAKTQAPRQPRRVIGRVMRCGP